MTNTKRTTKKSKKAATKPRALSPSQIRAQNRNKRKELNEVK